MKDHTRLLLTLAVAIACATGCKNVDEVAPDSGDTATDTGPGIDAGSDADGDGDTDGDGDSDWDTDPNPACHRYVNVAATAVSPDGLSWGTAFPTVQQGINSAAGQTGGCEVWVAKGLYSIFADNWKNTVKLAPEVYVYGGFAGDETSRDERDWRQNETILDGHDVGGSNQVFHVVTGSDDAILDGFTITGGDARGNSPDTNGGGMYNVDVAPTVRNCRFVVNAASKGRGGGMYNAMNGSVAGVLTIESCVFEDNDNGGMVNDTVTGTIRGCVFTRNHGGGLAINGGKVTVENSLFISNYGVGATNSFTESDSCRYKGCVFAGNSSPYAGAMLSVEPSTPVIEDCVFSGNFCTGQYSGGIENYDGGATVSRSIFSGNWTQGDGAAYRLGYSAHVPSVTLTSNVFVGNVARGSGGAIWNTMRTVGIASSTFHGNEAYAQGGAVYSDDFGTVDVQGSILWGDGPVEIDKADTVINVSKSDVENGGYTTNGNLDADPLFDDPAIAGTWSEVTYDETVYQTALGDDSKSWVVGALKGMFVTVGVAAEVDGGAEDELSFYIADNTEDTIYVWGDMSGHVPSGGFYSVLDLRLSAGSPCIDAADDAVAPVTDILGHSRVDVAGKGADGVLADMGAYEYEP
ncbi:MAG: right-handed parallel beta-helix repeat-containing protein [Deltaproteobacteria bacterium]|nr:right-handed parallel beta-helix repeat-containing protein [Deltaproteobacteria bacterium]